MKYIILELIPTSLNPDKGNIIQLSALKIDNLKLLDRFDYRLNKELIPLQSMIDMISYDEEMFIYKNSKEEILNDFKKWIEDYKLLVMDNEYTLNYLKEIENEKESIFNKLNLPYSEDVIDIMINKYHLEPTNHIVDLLYEALMFENGNNE